MANQDYTFAGMFKWVRNTQPNQWGKYSLSFYPATSEVRKAIKATGIRNDLKEDDDGFFYNLASKEPFDVLDDDLKPVTALVGNGSTGSVSISVETFTSPKYGEVTRSQVTRVVIDNLIPYEPKADADEGEDDETPAKPAPKPAKKGKTTPW